MQKEGDVGKKTNQSDYRVLYFLITIAQGMECPLRFWPLVLVMVKLLMFMFSSLVYFLRHNCFDVVG